MLMFQSLRRLTRIRWMSFLLLPALMLAVAGFPAGAQDKDKKEPIPKKPKEEIEDPVKKKLKPVTVDEDDTKPKEASKTATPAASDLAKAAERAKHRDVKKL